MSDVFLFRRKALRMFVKIKTCTESDDGNTSKFNWFIQ